MISAITIGRDKELLITGDIHENEYLFDKLIQQTNIGDKRILVVIGDVWNIHESGISKSIIRKIARLSAAGWAYMIKGNHEQKIINKNREPSMEVEWCRTLPLILNFIFTNLNNISVVHGGVTPFHTRENVSTDPEVMYIRTLDENNKPVPVQWIDGKLQPQKNGIAWHEVYDGRFGYMISSHGSDEAPIKHFKHSCSINSRCYKNKGIIGQVVSSQGTLGKVYELGNF